MVRLYNDDDLEEFLSCYRTGFNPDKGEGRNRFALTRDLAHYKETTFVAENQGMIVGVIMGVIAHRKAWLTSLAVVPGLPPVNLYVLRLMQALGNRLLTFGFDEAWATSDRGTVISLAETVQAQVMQRGGVYEPNDAKVLFKATTLTLKNLERFF